MSYRPATHTHECTTQDNTGRCFRIPSCSVQMYAVKPRTGLGLSAVRHLSLLWHADTPSGSRCSVRMSCSTLDVQSVIRESAPPTERSTVIAQPDGQHEAIGGRLIIAMSYVALGKQWFSSEYRLSAVYRWWCKQWTSRPDQWRHEMHIITWTLRLASWRAFERVTAAPRCKRVGLTCARVAESIITAVHCLCACGSMWVGCRWFAQRSLTISV